MEKKTNHLTTSNQSKEYFSITGCSKNLVRKILIFFCRGQRWNHCLKICYPAAEPWCPRPSRVVRSDKFVSHLFIHVLFTILIIVLLETLLYMNPFVSKDSLQSLFSVCVRCRKDKFSRKCWAQMVSTIVPVFLYHI